MFDRRRTQAAAVGIALAVLLSGCSALRNGVMNHAGTVTQQEWHLYSILAIVLIFVAGPVLLLTPLMAWHYRISNRDHAYRPTWRFSWPLEGFIWIPPIGIVIGLSFLLWNYTHRLDPYKPLAGNQPAVEVQVVSFDWKWLFIYPDQGIASVNQLAIPAGRPVHLTLTSGTVMQSFLIPRLASQIYTMAGMKTQLNFAASQPGSYSGLNTQYNGTGFARQKFQVLALPPGQYRAWTARVKAGGRPFDGNVVKALFHQSTVASPQFYRNVPANAFAAIMQRATGENAGE